MFEHVRRTNLPAFVAVVSLAMLAPFLFWYVLPEAWGQLVVNATGGVIALDLLFYVVEICLILLFLTTVGRLRLRDLGLASSLPRALVFAALLWALTQLGIALWQLGTAGQIVWNEAWRDPGAAVVAEDLYSQLLGNALFEEIVWRGFVLVQLYLFAKRRNVRRPLVLALVISQLLFALLHTPLQLERFGRSWLELPFWLLATGVAGVIFAVLYVKTQNLFIAVGFHALFNEPTQLFAPPLDPSQIPTAIVTLLGLALVFWPVTGRLWQEPSRSPSQPGAAQR